MSPSETGASEDDSIGAADGEAVVSVVACATSGGDEREVGSVTLERDPRRQQQTVRVSNAASRAGRRVRLRVVADQPPLEWRVREDDATGGTGTATAALVRFRAGTLVLESRVTFPQARTCHVGDAPTERALGSLRALGVVVQLRFAPSSFVNSNSAFESTNATPPVPATSFRSWTARSPSTTTARSGARRSPPPRASPSRCRETCFSPSGNRPRRAPAARRTSGTPSRRRTPKTTPR